MKNRICNGLLAGSLLLACSCSNLFTSFANTHSDEAMFVSMREFVTNKDYSSAIALIPYFSTTYQNRPDVKRLEASAYLGRAGLDYLTFVPNLSALNLATTDLMVFFMKQFDSMGPRVSEADAVQSGAAAAVDFLYPSRFYVGSVDGSCACRHGEDGSDHQPVW